MASSKHSKHSAKQSFLDKAKIIDNELANYGTFTSLEQKTGVPKTQLLAVFCVVILFMLIFGFGVNIIGHLISLIWPAYRSYVVIDALEKLIRVKKDKDQQPVHVYGRSKADQVAELETYAEIRKQLTMPKRNIIYSNLGTDQKKIEDFLEKERGKLMEKCYNKTKKYLMYWVVYGVFYLFEYVFRVLMWWLPFYFLIKIAFLLWCVHPKYQGSSVVYQNVFAPFLRARRPFIDSWILTGREMVRTTFKELQADAEEVLQNTPMNTDNILEAGKVIASHAQKSIKRVRKMTSNIETAPEQKRNDVK